MEPASKRPREGEADEDGARLKLQVSLPSGRSEDVLVDPSATVGDLKLAAQRALRQGFLTLTLDGRLLDPAESLQSAGLRDGDCIAAIAQQPKVAATQGGFALWCIGRDRIVTWGDPARGGDSTAIQDQLKNVQKIHATHGAFAAILAHGTVVTWGQPLLGGDSTAVQDQLKNVQQISGTAAAFAAILSDGTVVTWGDPFLGGDSTAVQHQLRNVQKIHATHGAFAAILAHGTVRGAALQSKIS